MEIVKEKAAGKLISRKGLSLNLTTKHEALCQKNLISSAVICGDI
jgi:hypothetical protein